MSHRSVLVTGAARGIGLAIATAFAEAGWNVGIGDLGPRSGTWSYALASADDLSAAVNAVDAAGTGAAIGIAVDVTDRAACTAAVAAMVERFGGLDLLVNNAGVATSGPLEAVTEDEWDRTLAVNTKGTFLMAQAAAAVMTDGAGIINLGSIAGRQGFPNMVPYCTSKFAVMGMTQALAAELAPRGIRVNAICPGILGTAMWLDHLLASVTGDGSGDEAAREARFREMMKDQIPLGRPQTPDDIAQAALYLADAANVTGSSLTVAGGLVLG